MYYYVDKHKKEKYCWALTCGICFSLLNWNRIDPEFINLLNKIKIWDIDPDVQQKLKARFVYKTLGSYRQNFLHMLTINYPTVVYSKKMLDTLPGELSRVNAIDNIQADCKNPSAVYCISSK